MTFNLIEFLTIILLNFLSSIIVVFIYSLINNRRKLYINFASVNNIYFGKGKNGYLEKTKKINEKTTYVELNYIFSISNSTNKPYTLRNIIIVNKKNRKNRLEEGSLNINGTSKSVAGVTSYDKLKHLVIKPYECIDYDVNVRMSKEEFIKNKNVYLSYIGFKNKVEYIKLEIKR